MTIITTAGRPMICAALMRGRPPQETSATSSTRTRSSPCARTIALPRRAGSSSSPLAVIAICWLALSTTAEPRARRGTSDRRGQLVEAEPVAGERVHVGSDDERTFDAAEDVDVGDAGDAEQARHDHRLGNVAQAHEVIVAHRQADGAHGRRRRRERRDDRLVRRGRQARAGAGKALGDLRAVAVGVAVLVEHERDDGQALDGFRAHVGKVDEAAERGLQWLRHARLDLLGGEARRLRLHHHQLGRELGEDVEPGVAESHQAVDNQRHCERQHDRAALD